MKSVIFAVLLAACGTSGDANGHDEVSCDGKWHVNGVAPTTCESACVEPAISDTSGAPCAASNPSTPNRYQCLSTGAFAEGRGCCDPGGGSDVVRFYECD